MNRLDGWNRRVIEERLVAWEELFNDLSATGAFAEWKAWAIQRKPAVDDN